MGQLVNYTSSPSVFNNYLIIFKSKPKLNSLYNTFGNEFSKSFILISAHLKYKMSNVKDRAQWFLKESIFDLFLTCVVFKIFNRKMNVSCD